MDPAQTAATPRIGADISPSQIVASSDPAPAQGTSNLHTEHSTHATAEASFSQALSNAQRSSPKNGEEARGGAPRPPINRWRNLSFLATYTAPRVTWPWTQTGLSQRLAMAVAGVNVPSSPYPLSGGMVASQVSLPRPAIQATVTPPELARPPQRSAPVLSGGILPGLTTQPLTLADYPHPPGDNGRGIHWIPTVSQSPEVVDRFVDEAVAMGMKWVTFLNEGADSNANDYLVKRLTEAGIEPVMRVYTPGLAPIEGDLKAMVRHFVNLGVRYFQLYNEPNLMVETHGQPPDVDRYLDLWIPAAQQVIEGGGLPGFGALSPQGEMDDRDFLRQALDRLQARGQVRLLDRAWLAIHNYTGPRPLDDRDGFLRFRQYDAILRAELGRPLPIIGTEGGTYVTQGVSEEQQIAMVTGAYDYMLHREPYNFAYTYWIIANGPDSAWDSQALVRPDGATGLARALRQMASGGNV